MKRVSVAVLVCALAACSSPRVIGESDEGTTVTVGVDSPFEVRLPANPTTGYTWVVADEPWLRRREAPEFIPDTTLIGAAGVMVFRLSVIETGTFTLSFDYERTFEDAPPLSRFEVTIRAS